MPSTPLEHLSALGQSVWIDFLSRESIREGHLKRLIDEDSVVGATSNPSIFQKAMAAGDAYEEQLRELDADMAIKDVFWALAEQDIRDACDVFRPIFDGGAGRDGYVSLEVDPGLAYDTLATFREAVRLHEAVDRVNLMVKIPATKPGLAAIEDVISKGKSINITLIFSLERYEQVAESYIRGLERLVAEGVVVSVDTWKPLVAEAALDAGAHVLAVAGRNARVERELRELAAGRPTLRPFGFTDRVPELMAAADVVIALPGAATCAEARVVGRRLLLLDVMPGHGRDNLLHELEQGSAEACGPTAADIAASATAMLDGPNGPGPNGTDGSVLNGPPRVPRWEPAFAAALATIGLDVPLNDTDAQGAAACVPSSLTRRVTRASTAGQALATRPNGRSARTGTRPGWRSPPRSCPTACWWTPRRPASPSPTSSRSRPAATWRCCTRARPRSRATSRWRRR